MTAALNKRSRVNSALYAILSGVRFVHTHHLICVIAVKTARARARSSDPSRTILLPVRPLQLVLSFSRTFLLN